jgi:hypothetical protein
MTTHAVANEFVSLPRQGRFEEVMERLLSADIVRVEPVGMPRIPAEMRGIEAVTENSRKFTNNNEIHAVEIDGVRGGGSVRRSLRHRHDFKPTGERRDDYERCRPRDG